MKNERLAEFLHQNRLKSTDLVEFWGVTKGVVSQILNGTTKLPTKRLEELLNNPFGWDTSMLTQPSETSGALPAQEDALVAELRAQIERLQSKVDNLNQELGEKNALLRLLRQGEIESA
jgi:hypothetical protein